MGDYVLILKTREVFEKKFKPNWSFEIFLVWKARLTNLRNYLLSDEHEKEILNGFCQQQLQKVKDPDVFLVGNVIDQGRVFVMWKGR